MWASAKVYTVYVILVIAALALGYSAIDYAQTGAQMSMVKSSQQAAANRGQLGVTHSWILHR